MKMLLDRRVFDADNLLEGCFQRFSWFIGFFFFELSICRDNNDGNVVGIFHPFVVFVNNVEKVVGLFFFISKGNIVVNGVHCHNGHIIHDCESYLEEL